MSIKRNTIFNLFGVLVPVLVLLFTVPVYLAQIGEERFGVLAIIWLVLGYLMLAEMGFGRSCTNRIAQLRNAENSSREQVFWTALFCNFFVGLSIALALFLSGSGIFHFFVKAEPEYLVEMQSGLKSLVIFLPFLFASSVVVGCLEGCGKFLEVNLFQAIGTIAFQVVPLLVSIWFSPSLEYLVPTAICTRVAAYIPLYYLCVKSLSVSLPPKISKHEFVKLFKYGGWIASAGFVGMVIESIDRLLISRTLGAGDVAVYSVAYQLIVKIRLIPTALSRALFPEFSSGTKAIGRAIAIESTKVLAVVMTAIVVLGFFFIEEFMVLWIGEELGSRASEVGRILFFGIWFNALSQIAYSYLQGSGRPDVVTKLHAAEIIPYAYLLFLGIGEYGLLAVAPIWALRSAVDAMMLFYLAGLLEHLAKSILLISVTLPGCFLLNFSATPSVYDVIFYACITIFPAILLMASSAYWRMLVKRIYNQIRG